MTTLDYYDLSKTFHKLEMFVRSDKPTPRRLVLVFPVVFCSFREVCIDFEYVRLFVVFILNNINIYDERKRKLNLVVLKKMLFLNFMCT